MNYLDIVIAVLMLVFGLGGLRKGIIIEIATLLGLVLGLYGAFHFSDFTAEHLVQWVEINPKYLNLISFVVTFIVVALLVNVIGRMVSRVVKDLNLGFIDKIGGFVVGVAKGFLLCSLLVMVLNVMNLRGIVKDDAKKESVLYPWVETAIPYVYQGFDLVKEAVKNANITGDDEKEGEEEGEEGVEGEEIEEEEKAETTSESVLI